MSDVGTGHTVTLVRGEGRYFGRGERVILVDGVQWGRTRVTYHGCNGQKHTFIQDEGDVIEERPGTKYPGAISIRSQKREKWREREGYIWKSTEDRVLEKAIELVATGRLRHPKIVRAEIDKENAAYFARRKAQEIERKAETRRRACEALRINDETSEMVDRVVAAMEWAREH